MKFKIYIFLKKATNAKIRQAISDDVGMMFVDPEVVVASVAGVVSPVGPDVAPEGSDDASVVTR